MRFIEDLIPLTLYPSSKKISTPINPKNKIKGSVIYLLGTSKDEIDKVLQLEYLMNKQLFNSYYIARDISAYIKDNKIENIEESVISESLYHINSPNLPKFIFDESCSLSTQRYFKDAVQNDRWFFNTADRLKIRELKNISCKIYEYKSYAQLQQSLGIKGIHGIATNDSIYIVSKGAYHGEDGTYDQYLRHELASMLIHNMNPKINRLICAISSAYLSKQYLNSSIKNSSIKTAAETLSKIIKEEGESNLFKFIKNNDITIITNYSGINFVKQIHKLFESCMSSEERNNLKNSDFGIPDKRKYPLHDESHVKAAIRMFNHVDKSDEEQLASNINSAIKKFNIDDIKIGSTNRFIKYFKPVKNNKKKEFKEETIIPSNNTNDIINKKHTYYLEDKFRNDIDKGYFINENYMRINNEKGDGVILFFNEDSSNSNIFKRLMFNERIKNAKDILIDYDRIKKAYPQYIKHTYPILDMYKGLNLYVDISYYNNIFLKNNTLTLDKAVYLYWDLLNRLINNTEISDNYYKKTIFIPIDLSTWNANSISEFIDYKNNINPISIMLRLAKIDPNELKSKWGNKSFLFYNSKGYFTIDFDKFEYNKSNRIISHINKLLSDNTPIVDDENPRESLVEDKDSDRVITANIVDNINKKFGTNIPLINTDSDKNKLYIDKLDDLILMTKGMGVPYRLNPNNKKYITVIGDTDRDVINVIRNDLKDENIISYLKLEQ